MQIQSLLFQGENDQDTKVTISVIVYYTAEFRQVTPDVRGHIEEFIAIANFALTNSRIPIWLGLHCILEMDIDVKRASSEKKFNISLKSSHHTAFSMY